MTDTSYTTTFRTAATPDAVYAAITDPRGWWDGEFDGRPDTLGAEFAYRFEDMHASLQRVTELAPSKRVVWEVIEGGPTFVDTENEWAGTSLVFELDRLGDETEVRFTHVGLVPQFDCYDACSTAWGHYAGDSLRRFIESQSA